MDKKKYTALGLMSGTSMDGVDASIISSIDGITFEEHYNKYYSYDNELYQKLVKLREQISVYEDIMNNTSEVKSVEKDLTIFHAKVVNNILENKEKSNFPNPNLIGFHGQTILHKPERKISVQIGDGLLLSQLTKKKVVYDFRQNDLMNGGQGAPLTPIFHNSLKNKIFKNCDQLVFINIGGISNVTFLSDSKENNEMFAADIDPGNCLIDEWIRKNSKIKYDKSGLIAKSGKTNELMLNQALENFKINFGDSLDIKDFDISFVRGLSLEDGASTLTNFTAEIITISLVELLAKNKYDSGDEIFPNFIICGGGRKNKYLLDLLEEKIRRRIKYNRFQLIDEHNIDGDFIESQAFGFLAIRSYLKLPISFPSTTGCIKSCTGGVIVKNF